MADFFRDLASNERDVIALQVVTMGRRASEAAREWFADNRYQDYLYLHGLSVEMAEAFAEYLHKRIRGELGFAAEEARDPGRCSRKATATAVARSATPPTPNLADQKQLLALLRANEIGITLFEKDQLDPSNRPPPRQPQPNTLSGVMSRRGWLGENRPKERVTAYVARRPGITTVPHPPRDIPVGTLRSIERQSDLKLRR
jgi:hypothetical protein